MSIETGTPIRMWGEYGDCRVYANLQFWGHTKTTNQWEIWLIPLSALGDITQLVPEKGERRPTCVRDALQMIEAASFTDLEHLKVLHRSGHIVTLGYLFDDDAPIRKWEVMLWDVPDDDGWGDVIDFQTFEHNGLPSEVIMEAWAIVGTMEEQA